MTIQRTVFPRVDGKWVNKLRGAEWATTVSDTQEGAVADAKRMLRAGGGGNLTVFDKDGGIVSEETVATDRWIDMTKPSGLAELLLRIDSFIALAEERDYPGILWNTAGREWVKGIDSSGMSTELMSEAQTHVDAAHAALVEGNAPAAIDALERVRQVIAEGTIGLA